MKFTIEVEMEKDPENMRPHISSVKYNGETIEKEIDLIGRAGGYFWSIPVEMSGEEMPTIDLVQWED
jgi:hypothetical protein